jgi:hypothetical protein
MEIIIALLALREIKKTHPWEWAGQSLLLEAALGTNNHSPDLAEKPEPAGKMKEPGLWHQSPVYTMPIQDD